MCYLSNQFINAQKSTHFIEEFLLSLQVSKIIIFVLGPSGNNIEQAAKQWAKNLNLTEKSEFIYCNTPTEELERALQINDPETFPIFVLCAVYNKLNELYFTYEDCYFFMHHYYMPLDEMQLVARKAVKEVPTEWTIASHPSPMPLLQSLKNKIVEAYSNAHAAMLCAEGFVDACITTEKARKIYSLERIHSFGSPIMLFTFGTTRHGINLINQVSENSE